LITKKKLVSTQRVQTSAEDFQVLFLAVVIMNSKRRDSIDLCRDRAATARIKIDNIMTVSLANLNRYNVSPIFNFLSISFSVFDYATIANTGAAHIRRRGMLAGWLDSTGIRIDARRHDLKSVYTSQLVLRAPLRPIVPAAFTRAAPVAWRTDGRTCRLLAVNSVLWKPPGTWGHFSHHAARMSRISVYFSVYFCHILENLYHHKWQQYK